jgi:hypothetical protein
MVNCWGELGWSSQEHNELRWTMVSCQGTRRAWRIWAAEDQDVLQRSTATCQGGPGHERRRWRAHLTSLKRRGRRQSVHLTSPRCRQRVHLTRARRGGQRMPLARQIWLIELHATPLCELMIEWSATASFCELISSAPLIDPSALSCACVEGIDLYARDHGSWTDGGRRRVGSILNWKASWGKLYAEHLFTKLA